MRSTYKWAAALAVVLSATAACGDDDGGAAEPSTASFCAEAQTLDQGDDDAGPYADFYELHSDPTPGDWAADGHLVTDALQAITDDIGRFHPSEEAKPYVDDVLAALQVMKQNSVDVTQAGEDGDQSAIDDLETVNQDTNVPALMTAMQAVEGLCESAAGS